MNKVHDAITKRRSFTLLDIWGFFLNFALVYIVLTLGLYFSKILDLHPGQKLTTGQWNIIFLGSLPLVAFTYLREMYITNKKERQIKERKLTYDCIGGAIEQLIEIKVQKAHPLELKIHYVTELLKYMEKVILLVLKEYGINTGEICANLMIKKENPLRLDLMYFGTFMSGRKKITLPINTEDLIPGAPEAYFYKKTMYINNTMADNFRKFFDETKPYRCIISIPIFGLDEHPFAILNIDSDVPDQFIGKEFVDQKIIPTINPLVLLIKLERDLILNTRTQNGEK